MSPNLTVRTQFNWSAGCRRILVLAVIAIATLVSNAYAQIARPIQLPTPVGRLLPEEYFEILQLYSKYSLTLDTGDGDARAGLFTPDGLFYSDVSKHNPENMASLASRTSSRGKSERPLGGHMMFNILITPTPEGARGFAEAFIGGRATATGVITGTPAYYSDTLVRTPYGWRFKTREVWSGDDDRRGPYLPGIRR